MPEVVPFAPEPIVQPIQTDLLLLLGFLIPIIILVAVILWKEVINPYRKRTWLKAYMITAGRNIKPIDVNPQSETFLWNKGTYFVGRNPFTREHKITVRKAQIYSEDCPHPLKFEKLSATEQQLVREYLPDEITKIADAKNVKALMTPKMNWKDMLIYIIVGAFGGVGIGYILAMSMFPPVPP